MNRLELEKFLHSWGWGIETWFSNNTMFVAYRGNSVIIGYPKSGKYREGHAVKNGLFERIVKGEK